MDSLSQIALGASVTVAVMGRRTAVWKAAAWGALLGTLPDLDALVDHGDAVLNMVLHRADSHALLYLSLLGPLVGLAIARLHGEWPLRARWAFAAWAALFTHPLLDVMTIYGTQLLRPFTDFPFGVGSVFIIDPLYTVPLLVGLVWSLAKRCPRPSGWALGFSTLYLAWGVAAQAHVERLAQASLAQQGFAAERVLVTPTAFNTLLWRVVAVNRTEYAEGFVSLLDATPAPGQPAIQFDRFDRGTTLIDSWQSHWAVERIAAFSHGFFKMQIGAAGPDAASTGQPQVQLVDLRMGQEPFYSFTFNLGDVESGPAKATAPTTQSWQRPDLDRALPWLWARMWGQPLPPPR